MRRTACGADPVSAELHERNSGDRRVLAGRTRRDEKNSEDAGSRWDSQGVRKTKSEVGGCFWERGEGVGRDFLGDQERVMLIKLNSLVIIILVQISYFRRYGV